MCILRTVNELVIFTLTLLSLFILLFLFSPLYNHIYQNYFSSLNLLECFLNCHLIPSIDFLILELHYKLFRSPSLFLPIHRFSTVIFLPLFITFVVNHYCHFYTPLQFCQTIRVFLQFLPTAHVTFRFLLLLSLIGHSILQSFHHCPYSFSILY